jgi:phosphatidate cytidylyltransferase
MKMSNLLSRVLVAVVAIPLIYFITLQGGFVFFLFIALIASLALYEYFKMVEQKGAKPLVWVGIVFGILLQTVFLYERIRFLVLNYLATIGTFPYYPTQFVILLLVAAIFVFVVILIELFRNNGSAILNISSTLFGVFYISLFLGMFIATRELFEWEHFNSFFLTHSFSEILNGNTNGFLPNSKIWGGFFIFSIFVTVWICDSAAYFAGRAIGKHKLFVRVSPNKTWEGAIFGFVFSIITMIAAKYLLLQFLPLHHAIVIGIIIGTVGQVGDLCQSLLKRDSGIKDSSALIPGHGGFFDRFDSIIFISPLLYLYVDLVILYI